MTYFSEHGQDRFLDDIVFEGKLEGVFVEVGALDGVSFSNTAFFERERDWSGVLIEANPIEFAKLLGAYRPRSRKVLAAVGDKGSLQLGSFTAVRKVPGWSGLDEPRDHRHKQRIETCAPETLQFFVPVVPLSIVLNSLEVHRIDYLSIDVEGAELAVLQGLALETFEIDVIEVENNYGGTAVATFMSDHGYEKVYSLDINDFYRKPFLEEPA